MKKIFFIKNYLVKIKKLIKSFIKKSKKEGIFTAFFIARKYIFDKESLIMEEGFVPHCIILIFYYNH